MKKTIVLCVVLYSVLCTCLSVCASETEISLRTESNKNRNDKIIAEIHGEEDGSWLSAVMVSVDASGNEEPLMFYQKRAQETNEIVYNIAPEETRYGTYRIKVSVTNRDSSVKQLTPVSVNYYSYDEQQGAISSIISPLNGTEVIMECQQTIGLPVNGLYKDLPNKDFVKTSLEDFFVGQTDIPVSEFIDKFNEYTNLAATNSKDTVLIEKVIEILKSETDFAVEYKWYTNVNDKNLFLTRLKNRNDFSNIEKFITAFKNEAFLFAVKDESYITLEEFLRTNNNKYAVLDFTYFDENIKSESLSRYAMNILAGKLYSNIDELSSVFKVAVQETLNYAPGDNDSSDNSDGGGTGGLRLGGGSASVGNNVNITPDTNVSSFKDIESVSWAKEAINTFLKEGVISGVSATEFAPNDTVTREQFIKIIINAFDYELTATNNDFKDVDSNAWYTPYIQSGVNYGLIMGQGNDTFGVGNPITRQDMAVIMYRVALKNNIPIEEIRNDKFTDAYAISDYAVEAVEKLYRAGIINGVGEGKYAPEVYATRAQAVKLIYDLRGKRK